MAWNIIRTSLLTTLAILAISCGASPQQKKATYKKQLIRPTSYQDAAGGSDITYNGGNGSDFQDAVIITGAADTFEGVAAEYDYIKQLHGARDHAWKLISHRLILKGDRQFDVIKIAVPKPTPMEFTYYFEVTGFFGKQ